jgi:hypothetical protein
VWRSSASIELEAGLPNSLKVQAGPVMVTRNGLWAKARMTYSLHADVLRDLQTRGGDG